MKQKTKISEAAFERRLDEIVMRRLATDRAYQNAANAEEQSQREREIERRAEAYLHALYEVQ